MDSQSLSPARREAVRIARRSGGGVMAWLFLVAQYESWTVPVPVMLLLPVAMFGALGVVFISRNPKIAAAPLIVMVALFILIPGLSSSVSVLVPVGALIAIGVARVLYKKGMLDKKPAGKAG